MDSQASLILKLCQPLLENTERAQGHVSTSGPSQKKKKRAREGNLRNLRLQEQGAVRANGVPGSFPLLLAATRAATVRCARGLATAAGCS